MAWWTNSLHFTLCDSAALQGFHKGVVFFWASWFCTILKHCWLKNVAQGVWLLSPFGCLPTCSGLPSVLFPLKDKYPPIIPVIFIIAHWCYHHPMTSHHHPCSHNRKVRPHTAWPPANLPHRWTGPWKTQDTHVRLNHAITTHLPCHLFRTGYVDRTWKADHIYVLFLASLFFKSTLYVIHV